MVFVSYFQHCKLLTFYCPTYQRQTDALLVRIRPQRNKPPIDQTMTIYLPTTKTRNQKPNQMLDEDPKRPKGRSLQPFRSECRRRFADESNVFSCDYPISFIHFLKIDLRKNQDHHENQSKAVPQLRKNQTTSLRNFFSTLPLTPATTVKVR